jgi:hypothetical protein
MEINQLNQYIMIFRANWVFNAQFAIFTDNKKW